MFKAFRTLFLASIMNTDLAWALFCLLFLLITPENSTLPSLTLPCTKQETVCGTPTPAVNAKIVGGQEAQVGAWPWMVALLELGILMCGGSVIHENFILTAAHCFDGISNDPSRWVVMAGKHDLQRVEPSQTNLMIKQIIIHEQYNNVTFANDIAILILDEPLSYSTYIRPLCVPAEERAAIVGEMCLLAGWGRTKGTGDQNVLNQVSLPIIADQICSQQDWYSNNFIPEYTFCAGYEAGGKDGCKGDSGGPLICNENGQWFMQGISSWGYQCAEYKFPGIYTNVSKYIDFIATTTATRISCDEIIG